MEHLRDAPDRPETQATDNTHSSTQSPSATATQLNWQPFVALRVFPKQNSSSVPPPTMVVPTPAHEQQQHGRSDVTKAIPWAAAPPAADRGREKDSFRGSGRKSEQGPLEEGHRQSREETRRGHNPTREEKGGERGVRGAMVRGCQREAYKELAEEEVTHLQQEGRGRSIKAGTGTGQLWSLSKQTSGHTANVRSHCGYTKRAPRAAIDIQHAKGGPACKEAAQWIQEDSCRSDLG